MQQGYFTQITLGIKIQPMDNENIDETQPVIESVEDTQAVEPSPPTEENGADSSVVSKKKRSWLGYALLAFGVLVIVIGLSALFGYQGGIKQRTAFEATQVAQAVAEQFALGLQDMENGDYETARQRFEYVIQLDPNFPGVTDKLAEVLLVLNATATPTPQPTPTQIPITPTPDFRGEEELFAQAQDYIKNELWSEAIETLEVLRKKNPAFNTVEVDDMLYVALRNRGVEKIIAGQLEGGIYDLTLAEGFGPLDTEANNWRTWARYYIAGASFWEIDWGQAVYYFEQVAPMTPNLHDGSNWTASQRYYEALLKYANWLEDQGAWCDAKEQYTKAYDYSGDSSLEEAIEFTTEKCDEK